VKQSDRTVDVNIYGVDRTLYSYR